MNESSTTRIFAGSVVALGGAATAGPPDTAGPSAAAVATLPPAVAMLPPSRSGRDTVTVLAGAGADSPPRAARRWPLMSAPGSTRSAIPPSPSIAAPR